MESFDAAKIQQGRSVFANRLLNYPCGFGRISIAYIATIVFLTLTILGAILQADSNNRILTIPFPQCKACSFGRPSIEITKIHKRHRYQRPLNGQLISKRYIFSNPEIAPGIVKSKKISLQ